MKLYRKNRQSQRGSAQVEFALTFLLIIFLVFWTWELIMVMYTYSTLTDAAKEGVRYAIVHGSNVASGSQSGPGNTTAVENKVKDFASLSLHDISAMQVTVLYADGNNQSPSRVLVTVSYPFVPYINLPGLPTIHASAAGRIAN